MIYINIQIIKWTAAQIYVQHIFGLLSTTPLNIAEVLILP